MVAILKDDYSGNSADDNICGQKKNQGLDVLGGDKEQSVVGVVESFKLTRHAWISPPGYGI